MSAAAVVADGESAGELLRRAAAMVPAEQYALAALAVLSVLGYQFLELHVLGDLLRGLRGGRVDLVFHPASEIYHCVASKCRSLHGRYLATPWLASPHLQTLFLGISGRPPSVTYKRQLYTVRDGGTVALDWLLASDLEDADGIISQDASTPIVVVVPGLTSDSDAAYVKHLVHSLAKKGWNVVVSNHRGFGGVSITSDCLYNAGWTDDVREIINYLHHKFPEDPMFCVGTSIGANILVKYLGEEGENTPLAGAASICSPWDLLVGDRFISRNLVQRLYNKALAFGLKGYAKLHQPVLARLANWEGIKKLRYIRDFDHHATCIVAKYETVDTYYRRCSSSSYVGNVSVPLLCVNALDDPVCTREAIPWDECRANKNIVLATTPNGGHLAFFEGLTARRLWWVGALSEFLSALHDSTYMHRQKVWSLFHGSRMNVGLFSSPRGPAFITPPLPQLDGPGQFLGRQQQIGDAAQKEIVFGPGVSTSSPRNPEPAPAPALTGVRLLEEITTRIADLQIDEQRAWITRMAVLLSPSVLGTAPSNPAPQPRPAKLKRKLFSSSKGSRQSMRLKKIRNSFSFSRLSQAAVCKQLGLIASEDDFNDDTLLDYINFFKQQIPQANVAKLAAIAGVSSPSQLRLPDAELQALLDELPARGS